MAAARLAQARKVREAALGEVNKRLPGLLARLEATGDERAAACHRALAGRSWDLAAARSVVTGAQVAADGGELDRLRRLALLTSPAADAVREAADTLRRAAADLDATAGSPAGRARALPDCAPWPVTSTRHWTSVPSAWQGRPPSGMLSSM